jgi:hypothetical protein
MQEVPLSSIRRQCASLNYPAAELRGILLIEWLRMPADLIFIIFGAAPIFLATLVRYWGMRTEKRRMAGLDGH